MFARMAMSAALLGAITIAAAQAQIHRQSAIHVEAANTIHRIFESAPIETWDDLRRAAPPSVRWHLAPPDEDEASQFRRSGWIEADGAQAGVAACGARGGPDVVAFRVNGATWRQTARDPVIAALPQSVSASLSYHEPTMVGETERFQLRSEEGREAVMWRIENCSREGGRARQRCDTTYQLVVRSGAGASLRDCRAP